MKFAAALFALLPVYAMALTDGLSYLESRWFIGLPDPEGDNTGAVTYDHETGIFTLSAAFGIGEHNPNLATFFQFEEWKSPSINYAAYDVCPNGDRKATGAIRRPGTTEFPYDIYYDFHDWEWEVNGNQRWIEELAFRNYKGTSDAGIPGPVPSSAEMIEFDFKMDPSIARSRIYSEDVVIDDNGNEVRKGKVDFCIRIEQMDIDRDGNLLSVPNFRMVRIEVGYDLTETGLEVDAFTTQVIEEQDNDVGEFEIEAVMTTNCGPNIEPYNQGQEICVQICPDGDVAEDLEVEILSVDELLIQVTSPVFGSDEEDSQFQAIIAGGWRMSRETSYVDYRTKCAEVHFLADREFFPVGIDDAPELATVIAQGDVTMSLSGYLGNSRTRKLAIKSRNLQETTNLAGATTSSNFEGDFQMDLRQVEEAASGASMLLSVGALAAAAAAALML